MAALVGGCYTSAWETILLGVEILIKWPTWYGYSVTIAVFYLEKNEMLKNWFIVMSDIKLNVPII